MRTSRAAAIRFFGDFWRGLTTPGPEVLKLAGLFLLAIVAVFSIVARNLRRREEAGLVSWRDLESDYCRSSVLAMRGASRETDASRKTFVFVGPSSTRCWLPHPDDADGIASATAGFPIRVLAMCGNRQGYAVTAALIDKFGADFDGWFIVGVDRQAIARENFLADKEFRRAESQLLGFDSDIYRQEAECLGYRLGRPTGWELWDRRAYYFRCNFGLTVPFAEKKPYNPYMATMAIPSDPAAAGLSRFCGKSLDRHLGLFERIAARIRAGGRARMALVETPWVDKFVPALQSAGWREDEAAYGEAMQAWSKRTGVPWIQPCEGITATSADFSDVRHVGGAEVRIEFLQEVTRQLIAN